MASAGIDARTGRPLVGWDHVVQSIDKIITTEIGSRVQRRDFGSLIPRLQDKPQNEETIISVYLSLAEALEPRLVRGIQYGEPRFALGRVGVKADVPGRVTFEVEGTYLPNGHKGDFSNPSPRRKIFSAHRFSDTTELEVNR